MVHLSCHSVGKMVKASQLTVRSDLYRSIFSLDEKDHDYYDRLSLLTPGLYSKCLDNPADRALLDAPEPTGSCLIMERHLCPLVVDACGVLLIRHDSGSGSGHGRRTHEEKPLVLTDTTRANVESVALAISRGKPVLLEGPIGAGKTALVEELARLTGRRGESEPCVCGRHELTQLNPSQI